jgi:hypothetical protein
MNPKWKTNNPFDRLRALLKIRFIALGGSLPILLFGALLTWASFQPMEAAPVLGLAFHSWVLTVGLFFLALGGMLIYVTIVTSREIAQGRAFIGHVDEPRA